MKKSLGATTPTTPTPIWVIGTYDKGDNPDGSTAAWGGICSSKPPCVGVSFRKATYAYENIMARQAFTVNIANCDQAAMADYFGTVSGRDVDKFAAMSLTAVRSELVDAPYVAEFPLVLECKLLHTLDLGLHTHFIGIIVDVKADEACLDADGNLNTSKLSPFVWDTGTNLYYALGEPLGKAWTIGKKYAG